MSRVERITFTVVRSGNKVKILSSLGRKIATLQSKDASALSKIEEKRLAVLLEWRQSLQLMSGRLSQRTKRSTGCKWEKKCSVWLASLRWRRNRRPKHRKTAFLTGKARKDEITWCQSCVLLLAQYASRFYEAQKRSNQPWRLWAQTVYSNLNKRKAIGHERAIQRSSQTHWKNHNQATHANRGTAAIQVCFDWD